LIHRELHTQKDLTEVLEDNILKIKLKGYSMYPLFVPDRDYAIIEKADPKQLKRGDVVLYRRDSGVLVLHRIYRVRPEGFYMVGDNQTTIEGPLRANQMKGKLIAFIRNGHEVPVKNTFYRVISDFWLFLRPVRRPISVSISAVLKPFRKVRLKVLGRN
jgi:signal peptidase I